MNSCRVHYALSSCALTCALLTHAKISMIIINVIITAINVDTSSISNSSNASSILIVVIVYEHLTAIMISCNVIVEYAINNSSDVFVIVMYALPT